MAEGQNEGQERTEEATPKRQKEASDKGQIGRSRELNTMALLLLASGGFFVFGSYMITNIASIMVNYFTVDRTTILSTPLLPVLFLEGCFDALHAISPILMVLLLAALLAPMSVGGWMFSVKAVAFKWDKMDPVKGLGRIFGVRGLMELLKALAKFLLLAGIAVLILWLKTDELLSLGHNGLRSGMADASSLILWAFLILSATTILIAAVDVPFQPNSGKCCCLLRSRSRSQLSNWPAAFNRLIVCGLPPQTSSNNLRNPVSPSVSARFFRVPCSGGALPLLASSAR